MPTTQGTQAPPQRARAGRSPAGVTRARLLAGTGPAAAFALSACGGNLPFLGAAPTPTPPPAATPTAGAVQVFVQIRPQEVRGDDPDARVFVRARLTDRGQPKAGVPMALLVYYPSGTQRLTSPVTSFPDGWVPDLAVPARPAPRGSNVRVEVFMTYLGHEYRAITGFRVT